MTALQHQGATVDHCRRCGGVFLERGETSLALSPEADPDTWVRSRIATALGPTKLRCPKDQSLFVGFRVAFGPASVDVDVCSACRGLWLDNYEGPKLRYIADEARRAASSAPGTPTLAELAQTLPVTPPPAARVPRVQPTAPRAQVAHVAQQPQPVSSIVTSSQLAEELAPTPGAASYIFQLLTGLPIEVHHPVKRRPAIVYSLIVILSLIFGLQMLAMSTAGEEGLAGFNDGLWLVPVEFLSGQRLWTVLTCTLLHGGLWHLLGNLYFLYIFGDNVEDRLGALRFTFLYVVSGIAASLLHVAFNASATIPCLGASGAIAGLLGAYMSMFPKTKLWIVFFFVRFRISVLWYLGFWIGYQILMGASGAPGVAWYAHIGGFLCGVTIAPFLKKKD